MTHLREHHDPAWAASVRLGEAFEDRCVRLASRCPHTQRVFYTPKSKQPGWDFSFIGRLGTFFGHPTVECKCDTMAHKTGNVFIQTGKNGKPHGLNITVATHWMIGIGEDPITCDVLVVQTEKLRRHILEMGGLHKVEKAGRSANTTGVLVPVERLLTCPGAYKWK